MPSSFPSDFPVTHAAAIPFHIEGGSAARV